MPIRGKPDSTEEILKNFNFNDFNRTTRQNGTYYYRHKMYDSLRIKFTKTYLMLERTLTHSPGNRTEQLIYHYDKHKLTKTYTQYEIYNNPHRSYVYDFMYSAEEQFQRSTIENQYFPTFQDFEKILSIKELCVLDSFEWNAELERKATIRRKESMEKYKELKLGYMWRKNESKN